MKPLQLGPTIARPWARPSHQARLQRLPLLAELAEPAGGDDDPAASGRGRFRDHADRPFRTHERQHRVDRLVERGQARCRRAPVHRIAVGVDEPYVDRRRRASGGPRCSTSRASRWRRPPRSLRARAAAPTWPGPWRPDCTHLRVSTPCRTADAPTRRAGRSARPERDRAGGLHGPRRDRLRQRPTAWPRSCSIVPRNGTPSRPAPAAPGIRSCGRSRTPRTTPTIGCVLLRGAGAAFSSGGDLTGNARARERARAPRVLRTGRGVPRARARRTAAGGRRGARLLPRRRAAAGGKLRPDRRERGRALRPARRPHRPGGRRSAGPDRRAPVGEVPHPHRRADRRRASP